MLAKLKTAGLSPTSISVPPLKVAGVKKILSHIFGEVDLAALPRVIQRHTGGNPLYVEEIAQGLIDDGIVTWQKGKWQLTTKNLRLPQTLREAIWRRLHHLDPDTQTLLRQLAV